MKPAERIGRIETYYFARKLAEVRALKKQGKNIINLGIGSPDLATPDSIVDALKGAASLQGASMYQPYKGIPELREGFAKWYKDIYNVDLDPEKEVLPLMGSKEAIMHVHLAFCNEGDTVLIPNPGYPTYAASAKLLGLHVVDYKLDATNNWFPKMDELEEMALNNCKVMWINYPHMPTGATALKTSLEKLIGFAKRKGILLVNDNPYSLILNKKPLSIHACNDGYEDVLELNSLSKSHNMSGWRVGVVSGSEQNIQHILKVKSNFDSGMFKPIQQATIEALNLGLEWFEELNVKYEVRMRLIWNILDELHCVYSKNIAGMFVWAKVPSQFKNGEALSDHLLYSHDIFATPGIVFGSQGDAYIRFSLCASVEELNEALTRIKESKLRV